MTEELFADTKQYQRYQVCNETRSRFEAVPDLHRAGGPVKIREVNCWNYVRLLGLTTLHEELAFEV